MDVLNPEYVSLEGMQRWAHDLIKSRPHDFTIGDDQLHRWWIVPRNQGCNVYLHVILKSDDDRAMHDHPWASTSYILEGSYIEVTPEGRFVREAGRIGHRDAEAMHRLEVPEGGYAISLFITGPKVREWGFDCPQGWVHWQDFCNPDNHGQRGRGCGEHDAREVDHG